MNSYELHRAGLLDDAGSVIAALLSDGWTRDDADALVIRLTTPSQSRAAYERFTPEQTEMLTALLDARDWTLPGLDVTREVAGQIGRSWKSVQSKMERLIAEHAS